MRLSFLTLIFLLMASSGSAQFGIEAKQQPGEEGITLFIKGVVSPAYALQWNVLNMGIVNRDAHNGNKVSISSYALYSTGTMLLTVLLTTSGREGCGLPNLLPDSSSLRGVLNSVGIAVLAPLLLANSQHYLNLAGYDTNRTTVLGLSLFAGTQSDYYDQNSVKWMRFAGRFGIECYYRFGSGRKAKKEDGPGIGFQLGVTKHWDMGPGVDKRAPWVGFIGCKVGLFN
jgi:hypothetical protein